MAVPPRPPKGASKPWLKGQVDDLASLPTLDEETLLEELKCRYEDKRIYTYVGDILVAVNPFEPLGLYAPEYVNKYNDIVKSSAPPHIFAIADQAYHSLVRSNRDQCAVISGESGAGKTESAKYMIKQIINLCHVGAEGASLENKILQVNPLLEAFGNAKTLMNDNSSRFGKYTELKFNSRGIVVGGQISEYLLEKSRVVRQQEGERNFHVFYYIFASPEAASLGLRSPADFPYTNTTQTKIDGKTSEMYNELARAMKDVGFSSDEQRNIQSILSAVLHLGKIEYQAIYSDNDPAQMASPDSLIQKLGELLKVDGASLKEALMVNITVTRGETIRRPYKIDQAYDCRDALAKALYGRLFGWIVSNINALLSPGSAALAEQLREIGILDIFGFEHFRVNGFEQLCINVANEQLQSFFNQHIFKSELEEYAREGIDGNKISFVDNQGLLDFFFGRPIGLFSLLDEESLFPKGTDESFVAKLKTSVSGNPNIILPKTSDPIFGIQHYAGRVDYSSAGFLERNRDNLAVDIITVCQSSKNTIISDTFLGEVTATGGVNPAKRDSRGRQQQDSPSKTETVSKKRAATVGAQFLLSLKVLVEKMMRCNAHFVRCIKPNTTQSAKKFVPDFVQAQLRYTGMLETTRIRREGYSYRPLFESFMERFGLLAFGARSQIAPSATTCKKVLEVSGLQGWLMGKTKVFLKYWHVEQLDKQLRVFNERAETLQKVARGFVARKSVRKLKGNQKELTRQTFLFFDQMNRDLQQMLTKLQKSKQQDAHRKATGQVAKKPPPSASSGPVRPQKSEIELKRDASILWWQEKEMPRGAGQTASGDFQPWFHGLISRKESERLLATRNVGCFLVRVSENRFGYTLSYRISDRCNHYMVEQDTRGRYALVGVEKVSDTLNELIEYFQRNQINKDGDVLREPCGQEINEETGEEECDYGELLAPGTGFGSKAASRPPPVAAPAPPPVRRDSKPQLDMPSPGGPPPINRGAKPR